MKLRRSLFVSATLLLLALPLACAAATPVYRTFGDWVVGCDNGARCEAIGMQDAYPQLVLRLVLEGGPTAEPVLTLESDAPVDPRDLRLDGARFAAAALVQPGEGMQTIGRDGAQARAFLDAIRNGAQLQAGTGEDAPAASLTGLSAALLLIDETQGRLDTVTALRRRGPLPAARVPAAPVLPAPVPPVPSPPLGKDEAQALIARVRLQAAPEVAREDCFVDPAEAFDAAGALDGDEALVMLECWRGAYQSSSLLFRTRRDGSGTAVRLRLPLPAHVEGERRVVDAFTNVDFSAGHLSHMAKGRGIADCGESASWTYDGRDFRLQRYHLLDRCRGGAPGEWPALWRSRGD